MSVQGSPKRRQVATSATRRLWGVSFDAVATSGVVSEFIKLVEPFHRRGVPIHLDLGYDIKADKGHFFVPYGREVASLPAWLHLDRVPGLEDLAGYDSRFVARWLRDGVAGILDLCMQQRAAVLRRGLAELLVAYWERLNVAWVVVENGTLPENTIYTQALRDAIACYGEARSLGCFVIWRDHDFMWSSETRRQPYGAPPYPHTPVPGPSRYIRHVCLHQEDRRQLLSWAPTLRDVHVAPNRFTAAGVSTVARGQATRQRFDVPADALLLARTTRIIGPKRLDRDVQLLAGLNAVLRALGSPRIAVLAIAGDPDECPDTHAALRRRAEDLGVQACIRWLGRLAPCAARDPSVPTVGDLLAAADMVCFLTAFDYDSFGNPIGEAIQAAVPFCTTRYARYDAVWGQLGVEGTVLEISASDHEMPDAAMVAEALAVLLNPARRARQVKHNQACAVARYGCDASPSAVLHDMLPLSMTVTTTHPALAPMHAKTRASIVLPVFNEATSLSGVLASIYRQEQRGDRLPAGSFELIVVDNNSSDESVAVARAFAASHPDVPLHVAHASEQGVACARKAGFDLASRRSRERDARCGTEKPFYLVSADADCRVDADWLTTLLTRMDTTGAGLGVCNYHYGWSHFASRPNLWAAIDRTLRCRAVTFALFGGFPDGKGFAVEREAHARVGGIEIFYQVHDGAFVVHPYRGLCPGGLPARSQPRACDGDADSPLGNAAHLRVPLSFLPVPGGRGA